MKQSWPKWLGVSATCVFAVVCQAAGHGYLSIVVGDVVPLALLVFAMLVMARNTARSTGQARIFWALMSVGCSLWLPNQAFWTWYGVVLQKEMPEPFLGDPLLFLHVVPFMAAVALLPHLKIETRKLYFGGLNTLVVTLWWVYLYMFVVLPDQFVQLNAQKYSANFDVLYLTENVLLVVALGFAVWGTRGSWRRIYFHLACAATLYALSSSLMNFAISRHTYYTGSLYDVPFSVSLGWLIWAGYLGGRETLHEEDPTPPMHWWIKVSPQFAMFAVLSIPVIGLALFLETPASPLIQFRLGITLVFVILVGACVFLKQSLLDRELVRLLEVKEKSFDQLRRLQDELVQKQKLAAVGQLAAGAAHEINNPLTAILGYSDLLAGKPELGEENISMLHKIGQQVRRTRGLVADLMNFAHPTATERSLVDVGVLAEKAAKIEGLKIEGQGTRVSTVLDSNLPKVWASTSQIFQVFASILENAGQELAGKGGGQIYIRVRRAGDEVIAEFSDNGSGIKEPSRVFDPFYTTKPIGQGTGLGLSAAYGIVQRHNGVIRCANRPEGGATFEVRLPVATEAARSAAAASLGI